MHGWSADEVAAVLALWLVSLWAALIVITPVHELFHASVRRSLKIEAHVWIAPARTTAYFEFTVAGIDFHIARSHLWRPSNGVTMPWSAGPDDVTPTMWMYTLAAPVGMLLLSCVFYLLAFTMPSITGLPSAVFGAMFGLDGALNCMPVPPAVVRRFARDLPHKNQDTLGSELHAVLRAAQPDARLLLGTSVGILSVVLLLGYMLLFFHFLQSATMRAL